MLKIAFGLFLLFFGIVFARYLYHFGDSFPGGILHPAGVIAFAEKNLIVTALVLMMLVVVPVFVMLFGFAWHYRAGSPHAHYKPDWNTNKALEIFWWFIPGVIIFILGTLTWTSSHELDPFKAIVSEKKPVTIQVIALDWKWLFIYPDDHIATVNYVEIPEDTPVVFKITADAPMNALWIPQLAGQIYAMPGMTSELNVMATDIGEYVGLSSNFSGDGFSGMRFRVRVVSDADYTQYLLSAKTFPSILTFKVYDAIREQTRNNPIAYYKDVEDGLFDYVLMKYMPQNTMHMMMQ